MSDLNEITKKNLTRYLGFSEKTMNYFDINSDVTMTNITFKTESNSSVIFNESVLKDKKDNNVIFVVLDKLDVVTLFDIETDAISLNKKDITYLIAKMKKLENKPILLLDNTFADEKDNKIIDALIDSCIKFAFVKNKKDFFDNLYQVFNCEKEELIKNVIKSKKEFELYIDRNKQKEFIEDNKNNKLYIATLLESLNSKGKKYTSTGFNKLDNILNGGLYEGLYILGGGSSNGKTTFVMQIGDYIASQGKDVLIFSLEMSRNELMLKSLSRLTLLQNEYYAMGVRDFDKRFNNFEYSEVFNNAKRQYENYSDKITTIEAMGEIGALQIKQIVKDYINFKGNNPIVIIDYLQILAPYSKEYTRDVRLNIDKTLTELKRITRDFKITIIAISSLNRSSYFKGKISLDAFKESGAIEYTCDVLIGLHFKEADKIDNQEALDKEKKKPIREMEIVILKNRNGILGEPIDYDYNAKFNYFKETEKEKRQVI